MTIASAIQAKQQQVADSYTAVSNKGGTLPATQNLTNLATAISTIPSGGSAPVITSLSVTPTTSAQTITAPSGTDGYSPVNVAAVTAAIDSNITAGNIKSGVPILGVTGNVVELNGETRSVSITSTAGNTFTPSSGKNAITSITVTPTNEARTVNPSTISQSLTVNSGYSGNGAITVNPVTASIDANITAENIKKDVTILGVTGSYEGGGGSATKYGANINTLLGDVNANGALQAPTEQSQISFNGVVIIDISEIISYKFSKTGIISISFPNLTTVSASYAMQYCCYLCTGLTTISFPNLTTVSGSQCMNRCFHSCTGLTTISFPNLTTVSASYAMQYSFQKCTGLTTISFPKLATLSGGYCMQGIFEDCTGLTTVSFPELTTASGTSTLQYLFRNCTNLTTVRFPKLTTMNSSTASYSLQGCSKLANVYFNKVTTSTFSSIKNQFGNMFNSNTASTSGTVNVHFPSNLSSTVSGLAGYPTFGGNSSRVVLKFDLAATS